METTPDQSNNFTDRAFAGKEPSSDGLPVHTSAEQIAGEGTNRYPGGGTKLAVIAPRGDSVSDAVAPPRRQKDVLSEHTDDQLAAAADVELVVEAPDVGVDRVAGNS